MRTKRRAEARSVADDDWYRRTQWTETDRAEFFARLKRSRGQHGKSQYLRIPAGYLGALDTRAALELLQRCVCATRRGGFR